MNTLVLIIMALGLVAGAIAIVVHHRASYIKKQKNMVGETHELLSYIQNRIEQYQLSYSVQWKWLYDEVHELQRDIKNVSLFAPPQEISATLAALNDDLNELDERTELLNLECREFEKEHQQALKYGRP